MTTETSYCRICSGQCGVVLQVEEDRIAGHVPDKEHPISGGYFCVKGRMAVELAQGAEGRLTTSLRRETDGTFTKIAADQALDEVAVRLGKILDEHGPESIAVFMGTGGFQSTLGYLLMRSFIHQSGTPNYFTTMTIDQSAKLVAKCRTGLMLSGTRTLAEADVAMIVGSNPVISHLGSSTAANRPRKHYRDFGDRGGKLIVIDPRRTETAGFADLLLQPYPGEDATIFAGLIKHILDNGWEDTEFCDRFVGDLDRLRDAVADFDLAHVARRAGVPADDLAEAARLISHAELPMVTCGTGPNMGPNSNLAVHLIDALMALCGGYRKAGERIPNPGTLTPKTFREHPVPPNRTWTRGPQLPVTGAGQLLGEFPSALLTTEIVGNKENKIRALIVFGGNPVMAIGDPDQTAEAFDSLDLLVTIDPRMNQTARISHYVIATSSMYERHDLTILSDQQSPRPFAQLAVPVVPKPPQVLHDWEVFWGLAKRCGLPLQLAWVKVAEEIESAPAIDLDPSSEPTSEDLMRSLCDLGDVPYELLAAHPQGWSPEAASATVVLPGSPTDHKLELCADDVAGELAALRSSELPQLGYRISVRRLLHTMNSAFASAQPTRKKYPTNYAYMNPEDMAAEGVTDGDQIEVTAEAGSLTGIVASDPEVRRGVLSMSHLWGSLERLRDDDSFRGANTGRLVSLEELEDINAMPTFTGIAVGIRRI